MARVTCPGCGAPLELPSSLPAGGQVRCPHCQAIFASPPDAGVQDAVTREAPKVLPYAVVPPPPDSWDEDADPFARPRRRPRYDDDDDIAHDRFRRPPQGTAGSVGFAVASLVLGIVALVTACMCGFLGIPLPILAIIFGVVGMSHPEGKGMAIGGLVTGIIALAFTAIALVFGVAILPLFHGRRPWW